MDPYVYPGSGVLKNLLDERDRNHLEQREYQLTLARRMELDVTPITGPFDLARWAETHRRLFQDVYAWAGRVRTVEISKGSSQFHASALIPAAAGSTFDWLATSSTFDWLATSGLLDPAIDEAAFVVRASDLLEKMNAGIARYPGGRY
ncbi:MAG: filamentation induced by cAMP protein Fic [Microbacterium sp.]|nr:filamentation induced by cAMP protein Fic [Microbacterium sp.]